MKISTADIIFLEMTTLELLNSEHYREISKYMAPDFYGEYAEGETYDFSGVYDQIFVNHKIVVTENTFDVIEIDSETYQLEYIVKDSYNNQMIKQTAIWKFIDGEWLKTYHKSTEIK